MANIHEDLVVQDPYRADGYVSISFDWGGYEGFLIGGKANGFGVQTMRKKGFPGQFPSDEVALYRGDWKNGKRDGYGRLEIPWEMKVYEGGWSQSRAYGFGKLVVMKKGWASEWEESGFKDGKRHGWGVKCITNDPSDATWRTGGFKDGNRHGYTITSMGNQERYSSVKDGIPHGYQTIKKDGSVQSREFYVNGSLHTQPTAPVVQTWFPSALVFNPLAARFKGPTHTPNGSVTLYEFDTYNGNLSYGVAHGYGVLVRSSAHSRPGTYDGGWKHGYACGYGVWMGSDGFMYSGGWLNGKPFGYGRATMGGGTYDTFWEEGQGWMFGTTWTLAPPLEPMYFRVPSPQPLPKSWAF